MLKHFFFLLLITGVLPLSLAQNLNNLSFGTDSTLDVVTWNIEWFPKNGQSTMDSVKKVIENINVDVIAFQEIDDTILFQQMVDDINGYDAYYESSYYAGLAYIYKTNTIQINSIYEIYTTAAYWNAFPRSPLVMDFQFMGVRYVLINNHFKCCGDGQLNLGNSSDEENRRLDASIFIKQYIDLNLPNENVIVLGDLNDELTDSSPHNVFQPFFDAPQDYRFADLSIANGNTNDWSYPNWPSHLDHILITNELFNNLQYPGSEVQTIRVDNHLSGGFNTYDFYISDHQPIAIKLISDDELTTSKHLPTISCTAFPNPSQANVIFRVPEAVTVIHCFNLQGQLIDKIKVDQTEIEWQTETLSDGLYIVKFIGQNHKVLTNLKVVLAQ